MLIRRMQESDLDAVSILEKENFSCPWSRNSFSEELKAGNSIYMVAEENQQIIGVCGVIFCGDYGEIMNVSVSREHRRQNIACIMLTKLLKEAENEGCFDFTLEVRAGNQAGIALYEKLGFESVGVRRNLYSKPTEDGVIYWKRKTPVLDA